MLQVSLMLDEFGHALDANTVQQNTRGFGDVDVGVVDCLGVEECVTNKHAELFTRIEAAPAINQVHVLLQT